MDGYCAEYVNEMRRKIQLKYLTKNQNQKIEFRIRFE